MSYLIPSDFNRLIQEVNLNQIISGNRTLVTQMEQTAITEAKSYLSAKYDVDKEFSNSAVYSPVALYKASNRVYLDASFYNPNNTYGINTLVLYTGKIFRCITAILVAEDFDSAKWQDLGPQYTIFYAQFPKPVFNIAGIYEIGDEVFWNNKTYTCKIATSGISHEVLIQLDSTNNIPYQNVFPDDTKNGAKFWTDNGAYQVPAGSILDTDYFTEGDNRNQQMIVYILDMLIYHLYRRIPPAVVPEIRILAYQTAVSWLNKVAKGDEVVADIVKKQPASGSRIRYGSRPKNENYY